MKRALLAALCASCGLVDGIKGKSGTPAQNTTPADWRWHGAVSLDQSISPQSDAPRLAYAQGKAWVAFWSYDPGTLVGSAWVTNRPTGGAFAAPVKLPAIASMPGGATYPTVAVGAAGDPVVAMSAADATTGTPNRSIWAVRLSNGLTVSASDLVRLDALNSKTPQLSQTRSLAVDENGAAVVAWGEGDGVHASASTGGAVWTQQQLINNNTAFTWGTVDVSVIAPGSALVGWANQNAVEAIPVTWTASALTPGTLKELGNGIGPVLGTGAGKGLAMMVNGSLTSQSFSSGVWGSPAIVATGGFGSYPETTIAMSPAGKAAVAWRDESEGGGNYNGILKAAVYDGSSWGTPVRISADGNTRKCWWQSCAVGDKAALCSWADFDPTGAYTRIWASLYDFQAAAPAWSAPVAIDQDSPGVYLADTPQNVRYINVAFDPAGSGAVVTYIQHGNGNDATSHTWANWLE